MLCRGIRKGISERLEGCEVEVMEHKIKITAMSKSYYVSASCSCGAWGSFKNLPKSRGYKTEAVQRVRAEFKAHKLEAK